MNLFLNFSYCFSVSCFSAGDGYGTGSSQKNLGTATDRDACYDKVRAEEPYANGAKYSTTGSKSCYAEFGMTTRSSSVAWESCLFTGIKVLNYLITFEISCIYP